MLKKIILITMAIILIINFAACEKKEVNGLTMSGSYHDNLSDFINEDGDMSDSLSNSTGVTKAYLQGITYNIEDLDRENRIATLTISVPNLAEALPQTVTKVMAENPDASYEELLLMVQNELNNLLTNDELEITTTTLDLPFDEIDGEYKLIYNEQWEKIVFGRLEEMYIEYYRTMIGGMIDEIPE